MKKLHLYSITTNRNYRRILLYSSTKLIIRNYQPTEVYLYADN